NLRCTLLVDVSNSMAYGNGPLNKYEYASTVAASLAHLVLRQQDAIACLAFDDKVRVKVPHRTKRNHLNAIIDSLSTSIPQDKTDMYEIFRAAAETYPRRGMMVVISDLLADVTGTLKGLKLLRKQGHDVLVFHIMDDDELDFPFTGPTRFDGLETVDHLNCNPRALRDGYLDALNKYLEQIRRDCARNMIDYALIRTSEPLDAALAKYLCSRLGMHSRN
ncbi:MAG: VWA domain-containing protein, partial [Pirellulaceae bacterium]|nr:VWA domain-containing protein [Pirellulaceae bacterium]